MLLVQKVHFKNWLLTKDKLNTQFISVQMLSCVRLFVTPWTTTCQASLSITKSRSLPKLMSLSRWCHPTVIPFSSYPQSFPASGSLQMNQLFTSVLPMNTQDWSPLGWTGWISLQSKGLSRVLQHHSSKASILLRSAFFIVQLSHPNMTMGKTIGLTR